MKDKLITDFLSAHPKASANFVVGDSALIRSGHPKPAPSLGSPTMDIGGSSQPKPGGGAGQNQQSAAPPAKND